MFTRRMFPAVYWPPVAIAPEPVDFVFPTSFLFTERPYALTAEQVGLSFSLVTAVLGVLCEFRRSFAVAVANHSVVLTVPITSVTCNPLAYSVIADEESQFVFPDVVTSVRFTEVKQTASLVPVTYTVESVE
jgi:hypothetical protein